MDRWIKIIRKPVSMLRRLDLMFDLIKDISSQYEIMMCLKYDYKLVIHADCHRLVPVHLGGSIVEMPDVQYMESRDQVLKTMEEDHKNICLIQSLIRYINDDLSREERAVIAAKYLSLTRKEIMAKLHISKYRYYRLLDDAQEKLIELWRLDVYGDLSEAGILLDSLVVEKRRAERTGLIGGYFANNTEWFMQYYK